MRGDVGKVCARGWCLGGTCGAAVTAEVCVSGIASEWERNPVCVHGGSCGVAESTLAAAALSHLHIQQQLAMALHVCEHQLTEPEGRLLLQQNPQSVSLQLLGNMVCLQLNMHQHVVAGQCVWHKQLHSHWKAFKVESR